MLATRAALEFAKDKLNTDEILCHGTSAGSNGCMTLTIALAKEGKKLDGAILDSAMGNPYFAQVIEKGCWHPYKAKMGYMINDKIGFYAENENLPHHAISNGIIQTPLYHMWVEDDAMHCGRDVLTVIDENGEEVTGEGQWLMHHLADEAIEEFNPEGASVSKAICVDDPGRDRSNCDMHTPTNNDALTIEGHDYNKEIYEWVKERLSD